MKTIILAVPVFLMLLSFVGAQQHKDISTYAPLPKAALGPDIPKKGFLVKEIKDRVYWVSGGPYQALIVATGNGVIIVDAPPSIGKNMQEMNKKAKKIISIDIELEDFEPIHLKMDEAKELYEQLHDLFGDKQRDVQHYFYPWYHGFLYSVCQP